MTALDRPLVSVETSIPVDPPLVRAGPERHQPYPKAAAVVVAGVLALTLGVSLIAPLGLELNAGVVAAITVMVATCLHARLRFAHHRRLLLLAEAIAMVGALALSLGLLSYLAATAGRPMIDAELAAIDRALGFDWLEVARAFDRWPPVVALLRVSYFSYSAQIMATVALLAATGRVVDLDRFLVGFAVTALVTIAASAVLPAIGPAHSLPLPPDFAHLTVHGTEFSAGIVGGLRDGSIQTVVADQMIGLISWPSLHAAMAVLLSNALRSVRWAFPPSLALNGLMIVSTITEGGHYLIDVIAGLALALAVIGLERRLRRALTAAQPPAESPRPAARR